MKDLFDEYNEQVMKHFKNPKNIGVIKDADGIGIVGNPKCGDVMKVYLKVGRRPISGKSKSQITNDKQNPNYKFQKSKQYEEYIKNIKVQTLGCAAAIATSSTVTELVKGKSLKEALKISNKNVTDKLGGLPAVKFHCSLLAEQGIKAAIDNYRQKEKKVTKLAIKSCKQRKR